jgi:hypothetical protein
MEVLNYNQELKSKNYNFNTYKRLVKISLDSIANEMKKSNRSCKIQYNEDCQDYLEEIQEYFKKCKFKLKFQDNTLYLYW